MAPVLQPSRKREKQSTLFSWGFDGPKIFLGLPNFPTTHKCNPGERRAICVSVTSPWEKTFRHSVPRCGLSSHPCSGLLVGTPQECTSSQTLGNGQGTGAVWPGRGLHPRGVSSCDGPPAPRRGLNEWSGRFRTACKLSDLKALFQVVLCSLFEASRYVSS